jgi:hypothetical protein
VSRSYKHSPICTDREHGAKWWKRQANHKVRRHKDVFNNKSYRKVYNSWNIHDHISYESKADAIAWYNKVTSEGYPYNYTKERVLKNWPTLKEYLDDCWAHDFYRK